MRSLTEGRGCNVLRRKLRKKGGKGGGGKRGKNRCKKGGVCLKGGTIHKTVNEREIEDRGGDRIKGRRRVEGGEKGFVP